MCNIREKLLQGDLKDKSTSGIMIIGVNSSDYTLSQWYCSSEEEAKRLAFSFCENTGGCYEIIKYELLGVIRPANIPTEYIKPETKD